MSQISAKEANIKAKLESEYSYKIRHLNKTNKYLRMKLAHQSNLIKKMGNMSIGQELEVITQRFKYYQMSMKDSFGYAMMPIKSYEYQALHRNLMISSLELLEDKVRDLSERPTLSSALCTVLIKLQENVDNYFDKHGKDNFEAPKIEKLEHEKIALNN